MPTVNERFRDIRKELGRWALTLLIWLRPYLARNPRDSDLANENFPVYIV